MAYEKRDKYPKRRKPGIYPVLNNDNQDKQLGLDNDNLEKFSLGTFPSAYRSNRIFINPNQIILEEDTSTLLLEDIPVYLVPLFTRLTEANYSGDFVRDTAYRFYSEVFAYVDPNNNNVREGSLDDVPDDVLDDVLDNVLGVDLDVSLMRRVVVLDVEIHVRWQQINSVSPTVPPIF